MKQIQQAGIAIHELDHHADDGFEGGAEVHIAHHKPADLLKKAKLLLGMLEPRLEFFDAGHRLHYPIGVGQRYQEMSFSRFRSASVQWV